jgi:hypothetical protein
MGPNDLISTEEILGGIHLEISHPENKNKIFCFIEGEADEAFYPNIFTDKKIKFCRVNGKPKVKEALAETLKESNPKFFGICDSDHDHLLNNVDNLKAKNIFLTDENDLEMMLLSIKNICELPFNNLTHIDSKKLLNDIYNASYHIGLWRFLSRKENLNITFDLKKSNKYKDFILIENNNIIFDRDKFVIFLEKNNKKNILKCDNF